MCPAIDVLAVITRDDRKMTPDRGGSYFDKEPVQYIAN
jgi:hypothetical protein